MSTHSGHDEENSRDLRYDIYQRSRNPLSQDETQSLNPILNALKKPASRYEEPELIAEGGEKQVYKVYDRHLNRFVAMAQAARAKTERDQEQFLREGQLTANLTHPNIVPIHNMGIDKDDNPFFSMELVPGDSLRDIIDKLKADEPDYKNRYPLETLLNIFNKVCDAAAYAHSRNVLHLDIKPSNIRVGQFGEVFLCDWGLSRVNNPSVAEGEPQPGQLDSDILNDMTLTGTMKGSPGFMAPEQVMTQVKTKQTDIYALGAILYLILTHHLPVAGKSANEILENTRKGNILPARQRNRLRPVSSGLAAMAMKALAFDPADRYASVQNLQADINRFLTGYPTKAEHANIFTRTTLLAQRHRKLAFWLMAFLTLLVAVMSVNLTLIRKEKQTADANFTRAEENLNLAEANFSLYRQQHEETLRLNEELLEFLTYSQNIRGYTSAPELIQIQTKILAREDITPETRQKLLLQKAMMQLMLLQFNAAVETYKELEAPDEKTAQQMELCREFAAVKPADWKLLPDPDMARFLTSNRKALTRNLAQYAYLYYRARIARMQVRPDVTVDIKPEEHIKVAGAILARLNSIDEETIPDLKLTQDARGYHLDMSGTPYSSYLVDLPQQNSQNVFHLLNLYSLDISQTPVTQPQELYALQVSELRMVGVAFEPPKALTSMIRAIGAKRVILENGEYAPWIIRNLRDQGIDVVEEEGNIE